VTSLETLAADRGLLAGVPEAESTRLISAAGQVSRPDAPARRRLLKAVMRERKAARLERAEGALNQTGIRKLRRQTVFTTPNVHVPVGFEQHEVKDDPDFREPHEEQNCYVCKQDYARLHHFYDPFPTVEHYEPVSLS